MPRSTTTSTYLRVERGLAPATIRAYRGDLARLRGEPRDDARPGPRSPDAAVGYLAARTRRGRPQRPGPRPDQPPPPGRRAQGLLPVRVRRGADRRRRRGPPGPAAPVPAAARDADGRRDRAAARGGRRRRPGRARPRRPPARPGPARAALRGRVCGSARRSGSTARTSRSTAGSCGSSARATRSGSCRSATSRSTGSGAGSTDRAPRLLALGHVAPIRGGPLFLGDRGGRLARQQAWARGQARGARGGPRRPGQPAHAAPLVRDASARGRRRPAHRPGVARTCEYLHDPAVHASDRGADPGRLQPGPPAGLRGRHTPDGLRRWLAVDRGADHPPRASSTGSCSSWGARFTILAVIVAHRPARRQRLGPGRHRARSATCSAGSSAVLFVGGLAVLVWTLLRYLNQEYVLTNRRVIQVEGVLNKHLDRQLAREDQRRASSSQSIFGRIFGFGDLDVLTAAESGIEQFRMLTRRRSGSRRRCSTPSTSSRSTWSAQAGRRAPPIRGTGRRLGAGAAAATTRRRSRRRHRGSGRARRAGRARAARPDPDEVTRTLANLADLRDRGAITPEEYEAKKADLLGAPLSARSAARRAAGPATIRGDPRTEVPLVPRNARPDRHRRRDHAARRVPGPRVRPRAAPPTGSATGPPRCSAA